MDNANDNDIANANANNDNGAGSDKNNDTNTGSDNDNDHKSRKIKNNATANSSCCFPGNRLIPLAWKKKHLTKRSNTSSNR
jgi:hypothetical protein